MILRFLLLLGLFVQLCIASNTWSEWCLWMPAFALGAVGFLLGSSRWFTGSDLFWLVFLILFVVAPASQLDHDRFLGPLSVRGIRFPEAIILRSVTLTSLFGLVVLITQLWLLKHSHKQAAIPAATQALARLEESVSNRTIGMLVVTDAFLLVTLLAGFDGWGFLVEGRNYPALLYGNNLALAVLLNTIYQLVPLAALCLALQRIQQRKDPMSAFYVGLLALFLMLFANPFNTARYQFAAFLVIIGMFAFRGKLPISSSVFMIGMFLFVGMPLMNAMKPGGETDLSATTLDVGYNRLDFDAFSMFTYAVHKAEDPAFGSQGLYILSTALFFVPRGMWPGKAQPSSIDLGQDLMQHQFGWFDNLSNPAFGDFYLDMGWGGIVLSGALFGYLIHASDRVLANWDKYSFLARGNATCFIGFLPILLRGSLGAVVGFYLGATVIFAAIAAAVRLTTRRSAAISDPVARPAPSEPRGFPDH